MVFQEKQIALEGLDDVRKLKEGNLIFVTIVGNSFLPYKAFHVLEKHWAVIKRNFNEDNCGALTYICRDRCSRLAVEQTFSYDSLEFTDKGIQVRYRPKVIIPNGDSEDIKMYQFLDEANI
jgi:hypothetical protein